MSKRSDERENFIFIGGILDELGMSVWVLSSGSLGDSPSPLPTLRNIVKLNQSNSSTPSPPFLPHILTSPSLAI